MNAKEPPNQPTKHVDSLTNTTSPDSLWESAKKAVITGDVSTLERLLRENVESFSQRQPPAYVPSGPGPHYAGADARTIIAREHDFESFDEFARHFEARNNKTSLVSQFESAVEAVISGDLATLERLLRLNPALIRARSARRHHATLLHYVGANGVEGFRQKTPKNAVAVAADAAESRGRGRCGGRNVRRIDHLWAWWRRASIPGWPVCKAR